MGGQGRFAESEESTALIPGVGLVSVNTEFVSTDTEVRIGGYGNPYRRIHDLALYGQLYEGETYRRIRLNIEYKPRDKHRV
jgi:hypothetical protein